MNKIFSDIKGVFKQNGNLVTRLIIINLVVFFGYALVKFSIGLLPESSFSADTFSRNVLVSGGFMEFIKHPWTLLAFPFTEVGIFALLFNLIVLYWFGNMLADFIGGRKMVITYVVGSFVALFFFFVIWGVFTRLNPALAYKGYLHGASAGTFALMYAYIALNPDSEIMFFTFRLKTRYIILAFLVLSVFRNPALGVLDFGAAVFGYLQMKLLRSGVNLTYGIEKMMHWINGFSFRRKKSYQRSYSPPKAKAKVINFVSKSNNRAIMEEIPSQEEVDFLLDKIGKGGYESLSKEEKERLHRASQSAD